MALRMKPILPGIISPQQGAFIGGREILDNVLLAQEFMHDLRRASWWGHLRHQNKTEAFSTLCKLINNL